MTLTNRSTPGIARLVSHLVRTVVSHVVRTLPDS